jgi:hypothetical protein
MHIIKYKMHQLYTANSSFINLLNLLEEYYSVAWLLGFAHVVKETGNIKKIINFGSPVLCISLFKKLTKSRLKNKGPVF